MKFSKYNRKCNHRRPTRQDAEIFATKMMLDHKANGIDLPIDFYKSLAKKNETGEWE
jgi:hypothetical protein